MTRKSFSEKLLKLLISFFLLINLLPLSGANVTVPSMELYTKGNIEEDGLALQTEGEVDLLVEGGYKFGGSLVFGFNSLNIEQDIVREITNGNIEATGLTFNSASIIIRDIFDLPFSFSYFVGQTDIFASGNAFTDIFGIPPITTEYRGFFYFSEGIRYDGVHQIAGTGGKLQLIPIKDILCMALYIYQDAYFYEYDSGAGDYTFDAGHYSADFNTMLNFEKVRLEFFLGGTYPAADFGYYRTGILFHAADVGGEFFTQIGIPRWDPGNDPFSLALLYMLFEVRLHLGIFHIIPTVFLHPGYYLQNETSETGLLDFNLNLRFGDIVESGIAGGIENNLSFTEENLQGIMFKVSPYIGILSPGVLWQLKINVTLFPFNIYEMFEGFIGIKAEF